MYNIQVIKRGPFGFESDYNAPVCPLVGDHVQLGTSVGQQRGRVVNVWHRVSDDGMFQGFRIYLDPQS